MVQNSIFEFENSFYHILGNESISKKILLFYAANIIRSLPGLKTFSSFKHVIQSLLLEIESLLWNGPCLLFHPYHLSFSNFSLQFLLFIWSITPFLLLHPINCSSKPFLAPQDQIRYLCVIHIYFLSHCIYYFMELLPICLFYHVWIRMFFQSYLFKIVVYKRV